MALLNEEPYFVLTGTKFSDDSVMPSVLWAGNQ